MRLRYCSPGSFAILLLVGVLPCQPAQGQTEPDGDEQTGSAREQLAQRTFSRMDKNEDGKLTKEELPSLFARRFDEFDTDEDGTLNVTEFTGLLGGMQRRQPQRGGRADVLQRFFSRNDTDGDGKITPEEALAAVRSQFATYDQNSDGVIARQEFNEVAPRFLGRPAQGPSRRSIERIISQQEDRYWPHRPRREWSVGDDLLPVETLPGEGVWTDPALESVSGYAGVTVWFDRQFLGDGKAYERRAAEFSAERRRDLRTRVIRTLQSLSEQSARNADEKLRQLVETKQVALVQWHWIVNGFSCFATEQGVAALEGVPGVKKIFKSNKRLSAPMTDLQEPAFFPPSEEVSFDPDRYQHPWYSRYLQADKTWKRLGVSGAGTLNVVLDGNFVFSPSVTSNLYRNPGEVPGNGQDDDGNGLIDDYHGYNFASDSALVTVTPAGPDADVGDLHGFLCAAEICGTGTAESPYEFGLAPSARWAGVVGWSAPESALEWAIEQGADTLSMSFSLPNLGEYRSHWRKMMEEASFCGLCCASGAGNFASEGSASYAPVPIQMRIPEDIPLAVFAPAGVQRNFGRTEFSSQGPVKWETEHYQDGLVDKPDFCGFNEGLPMLLPDGSARSFGMNGNSFAGPTTAGTLALMLSADPDLLPWNARQILIDTAIDVADPGFDHQTGHGLMNCYRAVKEVLRRKCVRDGDDPTPYEGRESDDALDVAAVREELGQTVVSVASVQPDSIAERSGLRAGDVLELIGKTAIQVGSDVDRALAQARESENLVRTFVIRRNDETISVDVSIPEEGKLGIRVVDAILAPVFE